MMIKESIVKKKKKDIFNMYAPTKRVSKQIRQKLIELQGQANPLLQLEIAITIFFNILVDQIENQ